jgi:hypothetical protein
MKKQKMWCGFVDDQPDLIFSEEFPGYGRLYTTKKEALHYYQDVRRVVVTEETHAQDKEPK